MLDDFRTANLVLGGYDEARTKGDPIRFDFHPDSTTGSELLVNPSSIGIQYKNGPPKSVISSVVTAVLDSTLPYLFLPRTMCDQLAELLQLKYDNRTGLYTIDNATLQSNRATISSLTLTISNPNGSSPIGVVFQYDAFNAQAVWSWGWPDFQAIFPIRRAPSDKTILGRLFLQEACFFADYTNNVFKVWQAASQSDLHGSPNITSVYNATTEAQMNEHSSTLSTGAIAGIAVGGAIMALVIIALPIYFCWWKKRDKERSEEPVKEIPLEDRKDPIDSPSSPNPPRPDTMDRRNTFESMSSNLTEMDATGVARRPNMGHI